MCSTSSPGSSNEPSTRLARFEKVRDMVEREFDVEEGLMEYDAPTFYVKLRQDSKKAFLRLVERLGTLGFAPILRREEGKVVLRVRNKPTARPSRRSINVALFLATIGTTLLAGYFVRFPDVRPIVGAAMFAGAVMAILSAHEMGHMLAARRHGVEATAPYFIPGPPPPLGGFGTFGAVIQSKSPAPNKDSLFDLGSIGPITGFAATILVLIVGVQLSHLAWSPEMPAGTLPMPLLLKFVAETLLKTPGAPPGPGSVLILYLHPVAFAGWVGMLVTMLQLIPAGPLDGGHAARVLLGRRARVILSVIGVIILIVMGYYLMAIMVFFLSRQRHPGPLDDVSKLTTGRKLASLALISIFVLCATPVWPLW